MEKIEELISPTYITSFVDNTSNTFALNHVKNIKDVTIVKLGQFSYLYKQGLLVDTLELLQVFLGYNFYKHPLNWNKFHILKDAPIMTIGKYKDNLKEDKKGVTEDYASLYNYDYKVSIDKIHTLTFKDLCVTVVMSAIGGDDEITCSTLASGLTMDTMQEEEVNVVLGCAIHLMLYAVIDKLEPNISEEFIKETSRSLLVVKKMLIEKEIRELK